MKEFNWTYHARVRGLQRVLGIEEPTTHQIHSVGKLLDKLVVFDVFNNRYSIPAEDTAIGEDLFLCIKEGRVATVRPRSSSYNKKVVDGRKTDDCK